MTQPQTLTKFQAIALPLVERGFPVTPVRPDAKAGATGNWQYWQYKTPEQVLTKYVEKYANCNGGVVGISGEGNLCFLDNDGGIPQDIVARLQGLTYTVASRPDSSHQHFYFLQSAYSIKKFGATPKTINIRDTTQIVPSPSGGRMYKTLFDVKGIGGASLVVAAGSTKPNGDVYTCINDSLVVEIPNWLVDWILEQRRQYTRALNRIRQHNLKEKQRASKIPDDIRERLRAEDHPDGFDVLPIDRQRFTRSQAFKFAHLGVTGEPLVNLLITQICRYVEGGIEYCKMERAAKAIRGIASSAENSTKESRIARMTDFYKGAKTSDGMVIYVESSLPVRKDIMRDIIRDFPDRLTCKEADERLMDGMNVVGVQPYHKRRDKNALSEIRKEEGFEVSKFLWTRTLLPLQETPLFLSTYTQEGRTCPPVP